MPKEAPKDPFIEGLRKRKLEELNKKFDPIMPYEPPEYEIPQIVEEGYEAPRFQGFNEGGFIDGESGGQDDDVDSKLPEGGYVINATVVSALGDGNTKAGAKKLDELFGNITRFSKGGSMKSSLQTPRRQIRAKISNG